MLSPKTLWVFLLVLWMIGATWWHVCKIKQLCPSDALPVADSAVNIMTTLNGLTIADGDQFRLVLAGNFSFARSGANANLNTLGQSIALVGIAPAQPGDQSGSSLDSLMAYLRANPGRTLTITGYYAPGETNGTSFANLGLARAEGVKQYLVQQGVPSELLPTKGEARSGKAGDIGLAFTPKGDSLHGGIGFAFGGAAPVALPMADTMAAASAPALATEEELAAAETFTSVFEPIDLYFPLNGANYIKTPETTKFFDEATTYLAAHTNAKLLLTGHTDNSGPDATNMRLSRNRANGVKAKLRKSGLDQKQITVDAKGESAPKVSNNTREGRKANRRVTVVVQ